jgi:hypothetical protein
MLTLTRGIKMGFGLDEEWDEEEVQREPTDDEMLAINAFDYDYDEFFELSRGEQKSKIWMAKKINKSN